MMGNSSRFKAEGYGDKYKICLQGHSLFYLSVRSFKNYFQTSEFIFPSLHAFPRNVYEKLRQI